MKKRIFNTLDIWYSALLDEQSIYLQEKLLIALDDIPFKIIPYKKKL